MHIRPVPKMIVCLEDQVLKYEFFFEQLKKDYINLKYDSLQKLTANKL